MECVLCVISQVIYCGGYSGGDPPLPIPNREVKPAIADGTAPPGGRVGSCRSSRSGPSHRRPGPFVFIRCLLSIWGICPSGGPVPFFEVRTFTSKARFFFVPSLLPSSLCQPRASCTGKPVAARGLVSGRGPRRTAWEGWSEAEGLPCKRPGAGLPGCTGLWICTSGTPTEPPQVHRTGGVHLGSANEPSHRALPSANMPWTTSEPPLQALLGELHRQTRGRPRPREREVCRANAREQAFSGALAQ